MPYRKKTDRVRKFFALFDEEFRDFVEQYLAPTVTETLAACAPFVTSGDAYTFAVCLFTQVTNDVPDDEREKLTLLFERTLPLLEISDEVPPVWWALEEYMGSLIDNRWFEASAMPFMRRCIDKMNNYLGEAPMVVKLPSFANFKRGPTDKGPEFLK